jgi:hypothetical protein
MPQHHCYIAVYAAHINLGFYHGASLDDSTGILEGTGKGLRHVKISSVAATSCPPSLSCAKRLNALSN